MLWHVSGVVLKDGKELPADLVVDCSGRNSSMPKWLEAAGFTAPPQTVVDSGLGASAELASFCIDIALWKLLWEYCGDCA